MVTLVQLPPQENPKTLTAFARPQNLHEHFLQFLASNGALKAEEITESQSSGLLEMVLAFCRQKTTTVKQTKYQAVQIARMTRSRMNQTQTQRLLARLFGYPQFKSMVSYERATGSVPNLRTSFKEVHDCIVAGLQLPEPVEPEIRHAALPEKPSKRHASVDERLYEKVWPADRSGNNWVITYIQYNVDNRKVLPHAQRFLVIPALPVDEINLTQTSWTHEFAEASRLQRSVAQHLLDLLEGRDEYLQSQSSAPPAPVGVLRLCKIELQIEDVSTLYARLPDTNTET